MTDALATADLILDFHQDSQQREALHFKPRTHDDRPVLSRGVHQRIHRTTLKRQLQSLEQQIGELLVRALAQQQRSDLDVEPILSSLSGLLLPGHSLVTVIPHDVHPTFDIVQDYLCAIPWESLDDWAAVCRTPDCAHRGEYILAQPDGSLPRLCGYCGQPITDLSGKLGIIRQISHAVHLIDAGSVQRFTPAAHPPTNRFLMIVDPTEQLCTSPSDPDCQCAQHINQIADALRQAGFEVDELRGGAATARAVLEWISDPTLFGVYYFGHGRFDQNERESCLVLHKEELLYASEIEACRPAVRFTFINACHAAAADLSWEFEFTSRNIGQAMVAGDRRKAAVAPLWRIANAHAARAATEFFQYAAEMGSLGAAMQHMRSASYRRYQDGAPDIAWMGYRYFGDSAAQLRASARSARRLESHNSRLFDESGQLNADLFTFPFDDVFLRAAKRRNLQRRAQITPTDVFAGLVRRGALTRALLHSCRVPADQFYAEIGHVADPSDSTRDGAAAECDVASKESWTIKHKRDLSEATLDVLADAELLAKKAGRESRISERDCLLALIDGGTWRLNRDIRIPPPGEVQKWLDRQQVERLIDENGELILDDVDRHARRAIRIAQLLAARCNVCPISNRAMLVGFLMCAGGLAERRCQELGCSTEALSAVLIASIRGNLPHPTSLLSPEVCGDVVVRMLDQARAQHQGTQQIREELLLRVFCDLVPIGLKKILRALPPPTRLDLDQLVQPIGAGPDDAADDSQPSAINSAPVPWDRTILVKWQDRFEPAAWNIVLAAAEWAVLQGHSRIASPHVFAALIGSSSGLVGGVLQESYVDAEILKRTVLLTISPCRRPNRRPLIVEPAQSLQKLWEAKAEELAPAKISERDLASCLTQSRQELIVQLLMNSGMEPPFAWEIESE